MLWLPYQAYTLLLRPSRPGGGGEGTGGAAAAPSNSPLGDSALLLLLVLLFHAPPQVLSAAAGTAAVLGSSYCRGDLWQAQVLWLPWGGDHLSHASHTLQDAPFGNPYRSSLQRLQDTDDLGAYCPAAAQLLPDGLPLHALAPALPAVLLHPLPLSKLAHTCPCSHGRGRRRRACGFLWRGIHRLCRQAMPPA